MDFKCRVRFFFFQAEDGIRDDLVTGVQTCALPISQASVTDSAATAAREFVSLPGLGLAWSRHLPPVQCSIRLLEPLLPVLDQVPTAHAFDAESAATPPSEITAGGATPAAPPPAAPR